MLTLSRKNEHDLSEEARDSTQVMIPPGISSIQCPPLADVREDHF